VKFGGPVTGLIDRDGAVVTRPPGQPAPWQAADLMAEIKDNRLGVGAGSSTG